MIVDDSALIRRSLGQILQADKDIGVVETASDGVAALEKMDSFKPGVVVLDVHMPKMDGLQVLQAIMRQWRIPVIMFSSLTTSGAETTLQALRLGAVDFLAKPKGNLAENLRFLSRHMTAKIKAARGARVFSGKRSEPASSSPNPSPQGSKISKFPQAKAWIANFPLIVIGCSTGGPKALEEIIPALPASFRAAIGIVQHMPEPFSRVFAAHLDRQSALRIKIAAPGDVFQPGLVLMAPGDAHLRLIHQEGQFLASLEPFPKQEFGWMPSVDSFFYSAARASARNTLGVLLTGMGRDGAKGMAAIKIMGGKTIAQDESTSVVYGMPRAAVEIAAADFVTPLDEIPAMMEKYSCGSLEKPEDRRL